MPCIIAPFGDSFPRFWTKGAAPDARRMVLAAAAILVGTRPTVAQGISILEEGRRASTREQENTHILLALSGAYSLQQNFAGLQDVASALLQDERESRYAFLSNIGAPIALKRYENAMALADERLTALENDVDVLQAKTQLKASRGTYTAAQQWVQKLTDQGTTSSYTLSQMRLRSFGAAEK